MGYDTDFTKEKVGLTQFGITLNSDEVDTDGSLSLGSEWVSLYADGGTLGIDYEVNVASQSSALELSIATVEFTLDWDSYNPYDLTITTQDEFDTMVASEDWLGATAVLFDGTEGAFTYTSSMLTIPDTVTTIAGTNEATFNFGIKYETSKEGDSAYSISDITIGSLSDDTYGFTNCSNLTNCIVLNASGKCYYYCTNLTNCVGNANPTTVFYYCENLIDCTATGAIGYQDCTTLTNCTAIETTTAFHNCTDLTNCTITGTASNGYKYCTNLTSCTASSIGPSFSNCENLIDCIGNSSDDSAFYNCTGLTGCSATVDWTGYGYENCTDMTDCEGTVSPD